MKIEIKNQSTSVERCNREKVIEYYKQEHGSDKYDFDELLRFPMKGNIVVLANEFMLEEGDEPEIECTIEFELDEEWAVVGWYAVCGDSIDDVEYTGLTNDCFTIIEVTNKKTNSKEYIMIFNEPFEYEKDEVTIKEYEHIVGHN